MPRGILERRSSGPSGSCYREASATKTKENSKILFHIHQILGTGMHVIKQTAKKPGERLILE
jgi:hypothetical protein